MKNRNPFIALLIVIVVALVIIFPIIDRVISPMSLSGAIALLQRNSYLVFASGETVKVNNDIASNLLAQVVLIDDAGDLVTIDEYTGSLTTIGWEHHKIHEGDTFTILEVTDLPNAAVRDILVITPDTTKWAHLVWELEHELETLIQFYLGTTVTDNGTLVPSFNRNGNSANVSTTLVYHTPTITNVGMLIGTVQQGSGRKAGGSDRESNEFILKQNTMYLIRITNLTANNNLVSMKLNWYESISP